MRDRLLWRNSLKGIKPQECLEPNQHLFRNQNQDTLISLISTSTWSDQKCHHHYPQDRPAELSGQSPPSVPRFCPVIVHPGHHHSHHRCHPPFRTFGGKTQGIIILCYMVVPVIVHPEHHVSHHECHPQFRTEHHNLMVITTIVHHDHHVSYHKYPGTAKEYQMSTLMCYHEDNRAFLLSFSRWLEKFNVGVLSSRVGKNRCMLFSAAGLTWLKGFVPGICQRFQCSKNNNQWLWQFDQTKNQFIAEQMEFGLTRLSKGKWQPSAFPDS